MSLSPIQLMAQLTGFLTGAGNVASSNGEADGDVSSQQGIADQFSAMLNQALTNFSPKPELPPATENAADPASLPELSAPVPADLTETDSKLDATLVALLPLTKEQAASTIQISSAGPTGTVIPTGMDAMGMTGGNATPIGSETSDATGTQPSEIQPPVSDLSTEATLAQAIQVTGDGSESKTNMQTSVQTVESAESSKSKDAPEKNPVSAQTSDSNKPAEEIQGSEKASHDDKLPQVHQIAKSHSSENNTVTQDTPQTTSAAKPEQVAPALHQMPEHSQSIHTEATVAAQHSSSHALNNASRVATPIHGPAASAAPVAHENFDARLTRKELSGTAQFDQTLNQAFGSPAPTQDVPETASSLLTELTENYVPVSSENFVSDSHTTPTTPPPPMDLSATGTPQPAASDNPGQAGGLPLAASITAAAEQPAQSKADGKKGANGLKVLEALQSEHVESLPNGHQPLQHAVEVLSSKTGSGQPNDSSSEEQNTFTLESTTAPEVNLPSTAMEAPKGSAVQNLNQEVKNIFTPAAGSIADQVVEGTTHGIKNGHRELTIRLNPDNLGEVRVSFVSHSSQNNTPVISARLIASTPESHEALQSQIQSLRNTLESQGVQVDRISVVLAGQADKGDFNQQFNQNNPSHQQHQNRQESTFNQQQNQDGSQNQQNIFSQLGQQQQGRPHHQYAQAPGLARYNIPSDTDTPRDISFAERGEERPRGHDNGNISLLA